MADDPDRTRMLANHYRHQIRPTIDAALVLGDVLDRLVDNVYKCT